MQKTKVPKKEVYFIATRYKNNPLNIVFYTKEGERVPTKLVEKEKTAVGTRYFATI